VKTGQSTSRHPKSGPSTARLSASPDIELEDRSAHAPTRARIAAGVVIAVLCTIASLTLFAIGEIALGVIMVVISAGAAIAFREGRTGSALLSVAGGFIMLSELLNQEPPSDDAVLVLD